MRSIKNYPNIQNDSSIKDNLKLNLQYKKFLSNDESNLMNPY